MSLAEKLFGSFSDRELKKINPITKKVLALETKYQPMSDAELQAQTLGRALVHPLRHQASEGALLKGLVRGVRQDARGGGKRRAGGADGDDLHHATSGFVMNRSKAQR